MLMDLNSPSLEKRTSEYNIKRKQKTKLKINT